MKTLRLLSLLIFGIINCPAQSPQAISYQAVARNNAGSTVNNQNISIRFSVRDLTSSGTILYRETHTVMTNSLGLFNLNIGQGTVVSGTFSTINWAAGAKFLQVEMDIAGGAVFISMGTQQMLSVPYALLSGNSSDNRWNFSSNNIFNNNTGNVGINSSSPLLRLDVRGSSAKSTTASFENILDAASSDAVSPLKLQLGLKTDAIAASRYGAIEVDDAGTKRNLILQPTSGNVGIGMTAPLATLQIGGAGEFGLQKGDVAPHAGYLRFGDNTGWKFHIGRLREASGGAVNTTTTGALMTVLDNGNVGIGTVSPGEKLDVQGKLLLDNGFSSDNGALVYNNTTDYLFLGPRSGTSSNGGAMALFGSSNNSSGNPSGIDFNTAVSSPALRIMGNGFIGIGTPTPEFKLTVDDEGGILAKGIFGGSGTSLTTAGAGTRLIWYPKKAAFRVGKVTGTEWDDANIGSLSVAMGSNTAANGTSSTALGGGTIAYADYSTALGYFTTAIGYSSIAMGHLTSATSDHSTALGNQTLAAGINSTAMGDRSPTGLRRPR